MFMLTELRTLFRRVDEKLDRLLSGDQMDSSSSSTFKQFQQLNTLEEFRELELKLEDVEFRTVLVSPRLALLILAEFIRNRLNNRK